MGNLKQYATKLYEQIDYRYDLMPTDNADTLHRFISLFLVGNGKSAIRGATIGVGLGALAGYVTGNAKEGAIMGAEIGSILDVTQYVARHAFHYYFTRDNDGRLTIWEHADKFIDNWDKE